MTSMALRSGCCFRRLYCYRSVIQKANFSTFRILRTTSDWRIRPATLDDSADILRMIKELVVHYKDPPSSVKLTEEVLKQDLQEEKVECLVAEENIKSEHDVSTEPMPSDGVKKHLVGLALFHYSYDLYQWKKIFVNAVFVESHLREEGLATELLKNVAKIGKEKGCLKLSGALQKWNKPALDTLLSLGGKPSKWKLYDIENEAFLELTASL